jgi:hypothetical protein
MTATVWHPRGLNSIFCYGKRWKTFPFSEGARVPIYCYGDSTTANAGLTYDKNTRGFPTHLEFYTNGRVKFSTSYNKGYGGDTSTDLLVYLQGGTPANVNRNPDNSPIARPTLYIPTNGLCNVNISTNDFGSANIALALQKSNNIAIWDILLAQGNFILVELTKPRVLDSSDKKTRWLQFRAWVKSYCDAHPMMFWYDGTDQMTDANYNAPEWLLEGADGVHPMGGFQTKRCERDDQLRKLFSFIGILPYPIATYNVLVNPTLQGSGGTKSGDTYNKISGEIPTGWVITPYAYDHNKNGTTDTKYWTYDSNLSGGECSWVLSHDGDNNLVITGNIASAAVNGHEWVYLRQAASALQVGDNPVMRVQCRTTEATLADDNSCKMTITNGGTTNTRQAMGGYGSAAFYDTDKISAQDRFGFQETDSETCASDFSSGQAYIIVGIKRLVGQASRVVHKVKRAEMDLGVLDSGSYATQNKTMTIVSGQSAPASAESWSPSVNKRLTMVVGLGNIGTALDSGYSPRDYVSAYTCTASTLAIIRGSASTSAGSSITYNFDGISLPSEVVKSVQHISVVSSGTTPVSAQIIPVDADYSLAYWKEEHGVSAAGAHIYQYQGYAELAIDGGSVTFTPSAAGSGTRTYKIQIIELKPEYVKNLVPYSMTIANSATTATYSLTTLNDGWGVTMANAVLFPRGEMQSGTTTNNADTVFATQVLTQDGSTEFSKSITAQRGIAAAATSLAEYGTLVEFIDDVINVQHKTVTINSASTTGTVAITSSTGHLLPTGKRSAYAGSGNEYTYMARLSKSSTLITATSGGAIGAALTLSVQDVRWLV